MSSPLGTLLWAKARIARHLLASVRRESKLKVAVVSVSALLLWLGALLASRLGFDLFGLFVGGLLGEDAAVNLGDLVMARLLSALALAVFTMLIVSNVLVAYATLYRAREMSFLLQRPIAIADLFLGRFYECVVFSSWAAAFLGSPILLAYGLERGAPLSFYLSLVLFYPPFVVIPAALGTMVTIGLVRLLAHRRRAHVLGLGALALLAVGFSFRATLRLPALGDAATVPAVVAALGRTQSPFLPSQWLAQGLLDAAAGRLAEAGFHALMLLANALMLTWLATRMAERWLYPGWAALIGDDTGLAARRGGGVLAVLDRLLRPLPARSRALTVKDLKLFWRDPAQWSQFLIFFGVLTLYVASLGNTGTIYSQEPGRSWVALLNIGACLLVLATLTTRFVYPLISLEGRRLWLLALSPLTLRRVVWHKFLLSVGSTALFTLALATVSGWRLGLGRLSFALSLLGVLCATAALSGLAVGLGSLYPNFAEDNPARIVSGMGGTLNFLLSLLYIALVIGGLAIALHGPRVAAGLPAIGPAGLVTAAVLWTVAISAVAALLPMALGLRNLERVEL